MDYMALRAEALAGIEAAIDNVAKIDGLLKKIDELLNALQPNYAGKLRIEFWKNRSKHTAPQVVVWVRAGKKFWTAKKVDTCVMVRKVKTTGGFEENGNEIKLLAQIARELLDARQKILVKLGYFQRDVGRLGDGAGEVVEKYSDTILATWTAMESRIRDASKVTFDMAE